MNYFNRRIPVSLLHIIASTAASYLIMCFIFPDLFVKKNISFIRFADTEINFYGAFTLISNLFHGGIQLWDPYNQMPLAYFYTAVSMLSFSTLWTAAVYSLIAPFVPLPGEFFHTLYSRFYYVPAMIVLCAGTYLLCRRFTKKPILLFAVTVIAETLLAPQMYLGLNTESLFSFFPLLIHFILSFFEHGRFRDALLAILTFSVCVGMFPLIAIGYFYQGVHFTILPIIGWWIVKAIRREKWEMGSRIRKWEVGNLKKLLKRQWIGIFLTMTVCVFLLLPHVIFLRTTYKDYDIAHEKSRFANFNPLLFSDYFQRDSYGAKLEDFFPGLLDFEHNDWAFSWVFLGVTAVFLTLCGIFLSINSRKYIFAFTLLSYWLLNSPRQMTGWQSIIHWINALTNPANVAVRSMHMTGALMLSLVVTPLAAMGLSAIFFLPKHSLYSSIFRNALILIVFQFIVFSGFFTLPHNYRWYPVVGFLFALCILTVRAIRFQGFHFIIGIFLFICFVMDGFAMHHYMKKVADQMDMRLHSLPTQPTQVMLDYQNPLVLPFRTYYQAVFQPEVKQYLVANPHNSREQFLRYTNYQLYFFPPDQYRARHRSYSRLSWDTTLREYVRADNRLVYQADVAIPEADGVLSKLLEKKLSRQVVTVDRDPGLTELYKRELPQELKSKNETVIEMPAAEYTTTIGNGTVIPRQAFDIHVFSLPSDFPMYQASSIFTSDTQLLTGMLGNTELHEVQGGFTGPFEFDVQNVATGKLAISVPTSYRNSREVVTLRYPKQPKIGITKIWKYEPDTFSFDYVAEKTGWLVFHYPYDAKWKLTVDNQPVSIYRVNYSFMGIPIQQGHHSILLEYYPDTLLRPLLVITMAFIMLVPFGIIWVGMKRMQ